MSTSAGHSQRCVGTGSPLTYILLTQVPTLTMSKSRFVLVLAILVCLGCAAVSAQPIKRPAKCGEHLQYLNYNNNDHFKFMTKVITDCLRRKLPLPSGFGLPFKKERGWWRPGNPTSARTSLVTPPPNPMCTDPDYPWSVCDTVTGNCSCTPGPPPSGPKG